MARIAPILILFLMAGCAQKTMLTKPGGSEQEFRADLAECQAMASGQQTTQVEETGWDDDSAGSSAVKGYNMGEAANAKQQRKEIVRNCMLGRGYRETSQ